MKRFVITGAHGFIGKALCSTLVKQGHRVTGIVRRHDPLVPGVVPWVLESPDFAGIEQAWTQTGLPCDCVIHLAARVHVMKDRSVDPLAAYRSANVDGVLRVAQAARQAGARRFVFVSSIKALGDADRGRPWREDDLPLSLDAYGLSKREAEQALSSFGRATGMEIVIVRPPLVYGPEVKANFLRLLKAVSDRLPLPLGAVTARRSLVSAHNLVDALILCANHDAAAGHVFHVTDGTDLTTKELVLILAGQLHRPAKLLAMPPAWLKLAGRLTGRSAEIDRLVSSLQVDSTRIRATLGWQAPWPVEQGLLDMVSWFRSNYQ